MLPIFPSEPSLVEVFFLMIVPHSFISLLEYNCFTMLCQFLLHNKVNQLYIYIYPHIPSLLSLPPTLPIPPLQVVTKHQADLPVLLVESLTFIFLLTTCSKQQVLGFFKKKHDSWFQAFFKKTCSLKFFQILPRVNSKATSTFQVFVTAALHLWDRKLCYWFSTVAITNYHKCSILEQPKFILLQFWRLEEVV